jgi:4-amino-4-deoxy-L-arabinose transferase-like glycosyltransferase
MYTFRALLIVLLAATLYLYNLGSTSIYILDEAKNASCAMEMIQRGDLVKPTFNNELRTDKPPFHYYMMMIAYRIGGINPFTARFFSALAGIFTIALVFIKVRRLANEEVAFLSALIALSSLQLTVQFHMAVPDPYLILWMTGSFLFFFEGYHEKKKKELLFMYTFIAMGFLTKGLIAVVFPALVILVYFIVRRDISWQSILELKLHLGVPLFLIIVLPWYLAVGIETNGEWLKGFFLDHNLNRYTETKEGHGGFLWAAIVYALLAMLPFSILIPNALFNAYRLRYVQPIYLFASIVAFVIIAFFSFSKTILPGYVGPAIPFISIFIGGYVYESAYRRDKLILLGGFTILLSISFVIAAFLAGNQIETLTFLSSTWWLLLILPVGASVSIYFTVNRMTQLALVSLSICWMSLGLFFFGLWYPILDQQNPIVDSQKIRNQHSNRIVIAYRTFNSAFVFHYKRSIPVFNSPDELQNFINDHPDVLIISQSKYLEELADYNHIYQKKDLFERTETVILIN